MAAGSRSLDSWSVRRIVGNMFPLLVVLSVIVLWAGITLEEAEELLAEFGLLAVMVPVMIGMGGNLGAIFSSRLSTQLHLGTARFDPRDRVLLANVAAILALAATVFTALPLGAWALGKVIGPEMGLATLLAISLISGMTVTVIAVVFSLVTAYVSFHYGIDPDDTTIPVVTNVVDVFGMVIFLGVSAWMVGY